MRIIGVLRLNVIPPFPERPIPLRGEGGNQGVLGFKHAIEARLRHAGSLDDGIDADGADALAVEQLVCRRKNALAGTRFALCRGAPPGAGCRLHTASSSRFGVTVDKVTDLSVTSSGVQVCHFMEDGDADDRSEHFLGLRGAAADRISQPTTDT